MTTALRGARLRAQAYRFMWAFNWNWWLDAVNDIHAFVNANIKATFAEMDERDRLQSEGYAGELEGLRSQVCLIIVPMNDTTSMFIANCIWYLARNPHAWEKLCHEVAALGENAPLTFDVLRNMPYLNGL
ncbi:hypothetical protein ETB97_001709 [Aspergillus alliaceus]|uniref:Uncharacterized protein n=1 Tax=Petromyces alliaceus TaxID=209559 RepID=A0A8H6A0D8_PETAA|nr:hypothetical protein ETB97_001709 [Aspergillus burnettii]